MLSGLKPVATTTTAVDWDPHGPIDKVGASDVLSLQAAYESGPVPELTVDGAIGILGRGEKDVYRVSNPGPGSKTALALRAPYGGDTLNPALCLGPVIDPNSPPIENEPNNTPKWSKSVGTRCQNRAPTLEVPPGEWWLVVFHDEGQPDDAHPDSNDRSKVGDSVRYFLELSN